MDLENDMRTIIEEGMRGMRRGRAFDGDGVLGFLIPVARFSLDHENGNDLSFL